MSELLDIVMIGPVAREITVYQGVEERSLGGAVVYSSAAAARSGARVLVVTACSAADRAEAEQVAQPGVTVQVFGSRLTTAAANIYHSADRETRSIEIVSMCDPFSPDMIPDVETRIVHIAGLFAGDLPDTMIEAAAERADVALDVQGVLRVETPDGPVLRDWVDKERYLPRIRYLKTDAAEAEVMAGTGDRERAGIQFGEMGAKEVMITHNTEVILVHEGQIYRAPLRPRNLSGRTGRGDTCFAAYLARRKHHDIQSSLTYAAALVSLKMETPGAFGGTKEEVESRMPELEV